MNIVPQGIQWSRQSCIHTFPTRRSVVSHTLLFFGDCGIEQVLIIGSRIQ